MIIITAATVMAASKTEQTARVTQMSVVLMGIDVKARDTTVVAGAT